ncbi:UNVERIFIED_ORG: hypothetical protein ABIB52_004382 [Arthrobacter sp. UYCu721]
MSFHSLMKSGMTVRARVAKKAIQGSLAAAIVAAVSMSLLAAPATAETQEETRPSGMTKVVVVSATENSNGGILTLENGQQLQLPAEAFQKWQEKKLANKPAANTSNTADMAVTAGYAKKPSISTAFLPTGYAETWGNCGVSWVNYRATGFRNAALSTGFNLFAPAIAYGWYVGVYDNAGYHEEPWYNGNYTGGSSWSGYRTLVNMALGYSWATVNSGSWAMLNNGEICVAGSPTANTTIY